jgi:drug/metabolite transporter superfamily protein YnfA
MIIRSVVLFALAGLAEIGGGYLIWLWLREGRPWWVGLVGAPSGGWRRSHAIFPTHRPERALAWRETAGRPRPSGG